MKKKNRFQIATLLQIKNTLQIVVQLLKESVLFSIDICPWQDPMQLGTPGCIWLWQGKLVR